MDSMAAAFPRNFCKIPSDSCTPEYGCFLGVVLGVTQNKKCLTNLAK